MSRQMIAANYTQTTAEDLAPMTAELWSILTPTSRSEHWERMTPQEKERFRDLSDLSAQLTGLEGWRVEVTHTDGEKERFIVGRSSGWRPCHIALRLRTSHGGHAASRTYASVRPLYRVS